MSLLLMRMTTRQWYLVSGVLTEEECGFLSRYTSTGQSEDDWVRFQKLLALVKPFEINQRDLTPVRVIVIE